MKVPSICIEDFFDLPEEVLKISDSINYDRSSYGISPGLRSEPLENKFPLLCKYVTIKVLAQYYDLSKQIDIGETRTHFNKVPYSAGDGIIHTDDNTITAIVYLNKNPVPNSGTSIYKRKNLITDFSAQDLRVEIFKDDKQTEEWKKLRDDYNSKYNEVMRVNGSYNSAISFNGYIPHKMNLDTEQEGERLTLIQFIHDVTAPESPDERFEVLRGRYYL